MINKVILVGRLGADAEVKQTSKGDSMANMSLATNKKFKEEEKTTWHKVVVFDPRIADTMGKYGKAGTMLYVEGEIETRSYQDSGGQKRYVTEVVVPRFTGVIRMMPKTASTAASAPATQGSNDFDNQF
ncbi:single-stranded DNA-binding protein [uncultured Mediterranean phage uvMED]|nr:single-stranded DNA-binding protein [uncultured Mediterranean phage uvMED]BAR17599.1 single-stranded DNA-binding protein (TIGR00621) [uncultured Mediterranean phage uvMED]